MKLYFVRHGESEANLLREISNRGTRHGLTAKGRAQATALAQSLSRGDPAHLHQPAAARGADGANPGRELERAIPDRRCASRVRLRLRRRPVGHRRLGDSLANSRVMAAEWRAR